MGWGFVVLFGVLDVAQRVLLEQWDSLKQLRILPTGRQASMLSPGLQIQTVIAAEVFPQ